MNATSGEIPPAARRPHRRTAVSARSGTSRRRCRRACLHPPGTQGGCSAARPGASARTKSPSGEGLSKLVDRSRMPAGRSRPASIMPSGSNNRSAMKSGSDYPLTPRHLRRAGGAQRVRSVQRFRAPLPRCGESLHRRQPVSTPGMPGAGPCLLRWAGTDMRHPALASGGAGRPSARSTLRRRTAEASAAGADDLQTRYPSGRTNAASVSPSA